MKMENNRVIGDSGEAIASHYLQEQGYEILDCNRYFGRFCEIDIIAKRKGKLHFVEVKTRKTDAFGTPFESITKLKYDKIVKGVQTYLHENPHNDYQIDVIGITLQPELKIEHLQNI